MPTYEYVCTDCDSHWEEVQKISADPIEICPKCSKSTAKRQISGGNFILKGGGWYADLYSSSPKPKGGEGAGSASGSQGASGAGSSASPASGSSGGSGAASPGSGTSSGSSGSSTSSGSSGSSGSGSSTPA